jgi:transposase
VNNHLALLMPFIQGNEVTMTKYIIAGIDISQSHSDVSVADTKIFHFTHNKEGYDSLFAFLQKHNVSQVVMEATGGYERPVCKHLQSRGIDYCVINPSYIRAFGRAGGALSKTDSLDAVLIRKYGEAMRPEVTIANDEVSQSLQSWCVRRDQLLAFRKCEKQRLSHPGLSDIIKDDIIESIASINERIAKVEVYIDELLSDDKTREKQQIMCSMPGIAATTANNLMAHLPELGKLEGNKIASLSGLAPHARESGQYKGKRHIKAGRVNVKKSLYMAALSAKRYNPKLKEFAEKLKKDGKAPKVIIIAVARKMLIMLNAMLKNNEAWNNNYA